MKTILKHATTGWSLCLLAVTAVFAPAVAPAQQRPPAVPLIAHDPYFSVWSMADHLTDEDTKHWTGAPQPIAGLARIDGQTYRFMGATPRSAPAMQQTALEVTPTRTIYTFQAAQVTLTVTFFTPAFPKDLDLLSRPVTYLTFAVTGDGAHDVSLLIDVDPVIAVNTRDEEVTWGRSRIPGLTVLNVGSREQRVLNRPGDDLRIDWGYFHLAVPDSADAQVAASSDAMRSFAATGALPASDDLDMPRMPRDHAAHLAVVFTLGKVSTAPVTRHVLLAYTEEYAIEYLGRKLRPYWQRNNTTVQQMLADAESQYPSLVAARRNLRSRANRRSDQGGRPGLRTACDSRLPPDARGAWLRGRRGRHAHALPQGELLQRLHLHRRRNLSFRAVFPLLQSCAGAGHAQACDGIRRTAALEVAVCAARSGNLSAGRWAGLRRRRNLQKTTRCPWRRAETCSSLPTP